MIWKLNTYYPLSEINNINIGDEIKDPYGYLGLDNIIISINKNKIQPIIIVNDNRCLKVYKSTVIKGCFVFTV